jgi:hypothetical protein
MVFLNQLMKPNPSTVASSGYSGGYVPSINTMGDGMGTGVYIRRGT